MLVHVAIACSQASALNMPHAHNKGVNEKEVINQSQKYNMGGDITKAPKMMEGMQNDVADWQAAMGSKPVAIEDEAPIEPVPEVVAIQKQFTQLKLAYLTKQQAAERSICCDSELCAQALMWRHTNP